MEEIADLTLIVGAVLALLERTWTYLKSTSILTYSNRSPSIWSIAFMAGWLFITLIAVN